MAAVVVVGAAVAVAVDTRYVVAAAVAAVVTKALIGAAVEATKAFTAAVLEAATSMAVAEVLRQGWWQALRL